MGIFSKNKSENELVLVFDIGSSKVGGTLFRTQKSGVPQIIFSAVEPIHLEDKIDIGRFSVLMLQSLEVVSSKIYTAGAGAPRAIFCVLSSPWYASQTRIIDFKKNTTFIFTSKLADSLVEREVNLFKEEYITKHGDPNSGNRVIELKNIKTVLNGYETYKPLNQKTKELEMTLFISMAEEQVLKNIENIVRAHFHFDQIKFSSFAMSSFAVVRDMYIQKENFLLVDVGGEVTDITMVKNNILRESVSFPVGFNFLIRGISVNMGCALSEASSLISLFEEGHAEASVANKLSQVMDQLKTIWLKSFQDSLVGISNDIFVPSTIYMTTDKMLSGFFYRAIKSEEFSQYTLTDAKFDIIILDTQIFHNIAAFQDSVVSDPGLVIDSVYINRFLASPFSVE